MCRKMRLREGNSKSKTPPSKHQTPNTKHQTPEKPKIPSGKTMRGPGILGFGAWGFFGVWCLMFGVWNVAFLGGFPAQENSEQSIDQARAAVGAAHRHVGHDAHVALA